LAHEPRLQVAPLWHTVPQLPQFEPSLCKETQSAPHWVSPFAQLVAQVPFEHT
jgi:hypothetical protein